MPLTIARTPTPFLSGRAHRLYAATSEGMPICHSASSVAAVGTLGHPMHLPHSVTAIDVLLAALIGAICSSTSATACIEDRRRVFMYSSRVR